MKTLVVLSALAVVAIAGPALPEDNTDFGDIKAVKRSPTLGKHHGIGIPVHVPVQHSYVQPVIPHHLGLKKPLLFHNHHGHHGHLYREDSEQPEARSAEPETKNKCMKEMKAKCDEETAAKSSELDGTQIEDIDGNFSESDVAESLQMAKEAVDNLQKNLQKAEKSSRMSQWKHGETDSDLKLHENVETAKQALDHMQLNFGNLESMKVHATTFKDSGIHDVHMEVGQSEQERLSQWKDAIENIQKNVELVKNLEDSFKQSETSEMKSTTLEKSSEFKQGKSEGKESSSSLSNKHDAEITKHGNIDMISSASSMTESRSTFHDLNGMPEQSFRSESSQSQSKDELSKDSVHKIKVFEPFGAMAVVAGKKMTAQGLQMVEDKSRNHNSNDEQEKSFRSESSQSQSKNEMTKPSLTKTNMAIEPFGVMPVVPGKKMTAKGLLMIDDNTEKEGGAKQVELASSPAKTMKSSNIEDIKTHLDQEKSVPVIDTTALMKSADKHSHAELDFNSGKGGNFQRIESQSHMDHERGFNQGGSSSSFHNNNAQHNMNNNMMHSHDQMAGQSQNSEMMAKPMHHGHQSGHNSFGVRGKSAESDSLSSHAGLTGLNAGFKSLEAPKSWKDGASRSAYGSGGGLGSGYGVGGGLGSGYGVSGGLGSGYGVGGGYGGGSAVGVFPGAHVGGCAIPLLLSCSPSVVAGRLAKAHSAYTAGYAAPAYRSSDDTNTHTKRDITRIASNSKVKRTSIKNLKQTPILITNKLL